MPPPPKRNVIGLVVWSAMFVVLTAAPVQPRQPAGEPFANVQSPVPYGRQRPLHAERVAQALQGTAAGTFSVNGKAARLAYAYVTAEPDSADKTREILRVTLSDVKLTPAQLDFPFGLQADMKAGKVHAVVAEISAAKKVINTMLYDKAFKMDLVSAAGSSNRFEGTLDRKTAAGKLYRIGPGEANKIPYEFSATFSAPIQRIGK